MYLLNVYTEMLPILKARESLQAIQNTALGTGSMKAEDSKPIIQKLQEIAWATENVSARPKPAIDPGSIGFGIVRRKGKR